MPTLFITGATGFIGRHLVEHLAGSDYTIRCLVRAASDTAHLRGQGAELAIGDVTDRSSVHAGMAGCDYVIHLANVYSFWERDPRVYRTVNVEGTRNVMECALDQGILKVVHVSSVVSYGKPAVEPFTEESEPGPPLSAYAQSKRQGDEVVWRLYRERGLPVTVVYPAAVLGPGDDKSSGQYLRDLVERRLPARVLESSVNTWVDVRDVADGLFRAMAADGGIGARYIIGDSRLNFREINELVEELARVRPPLMSMPNCLAMIAARLLTTQTQRRPGDADVWYLLAETYGLLDDIPGVHQARAEYFVRTGDLDQAVKQLQFAVPLIRDDFQLNAKITQRIREIHSLRQEARR